MRGLAFFSLPPAALAFSRQVTKLGDPLVAPFVVSQHRRVELELDELAHIEHILVMLKAQLASPPPPEA